jgi:phosphate transport system substrate-binding protein
MGFGPAEAANADSSHAAAEEFGASDLGGLVRQWLFALQRHHAGTKIRLLPTRLLASPTVFDAAYEDTVYVGYRLNRQAIDGVARKYGYGPTPVRIALDAVVVLVHPENPIQGMTLAQVDSVFSRSPGCRSDRHAAAWGSLGLGGVWETRPVQLFAIGSGDEMHDYFREQVLCGGELSELVQVRPHSAAVAHAVSGSLNAIGFARRGGAESAKTVPLAAEANMPFVAPTVRNIVNGTYPLTRLLHLYVDKRPNEPLTGAVVEFVRFALSAEGQEIVRRSGYVPLSHDVAEMEQNALFADRP